LAGELREIVLRYQPDIEELKEGDHKKFEWR
jgi:hypothetical protein